ncbi:MAG: UDP-galactopyranose mutase, partial [Segatella copri]|nr:UDP-galactopyranose mutase [Segatella copri]
TEREIPYTRVIEHKHFEMFGQEVYETPKTVISKEFSTEWKDGMEPYYPVNDEINSSLYSMYKALADNEDNVIFGGRLAEYKYYDMAPTVERAMEWWNSKE